MLGLMLCGYHLETLNFGRFANVFITESVTCISAGSLTILIILLSPELSLEPGK